MHIIKTPLLYIRGHFYLSLQIHDFRCVHTMVTPYINNVQDYSVLNNNAVRTVYICESWQFTCGKHLHDSIISLTGGLDPSK